MGAAYFFSLQISLSKPQPVLQLLSIKDTAHGRGCGEGGCWQLWGTSLTLIWLEILVTVSLLEPMATCAAILPYTAFCFPTCLCLLTPDSCMPPQVYLMEALIMARFLWLQLVLLRNETFTLLLDMYSTTGLNMCMCCICMIRHVMTLTVQEVQGEVIFNIAKVGIVPLSVF